MSTGAPTQWNWSFGDNETATVQHPVHTYKLAGNHTVTLTTSNAGGMDVSVKNRYIIIYPKGDFNHNWKVDTGDAALVAYMVVNRAPHLLPDADFNSNGFVDIGDAGKIAYFIVTKIKEL
ncbi:MAG: PKD domain-containing protein [Methanoregula sp.]|nr:PKD domain-containing protein [Methanoregula sp.]